MNLVLVILFVIIVLLIIPVEFIIDYRYTDGYGNLNIFTSYLFGLLRPKIHPFERKNKNKLQNGNVIDKIKRIRNIRYNNYIKTIWNRIIIKKFEWDTKIGLEDAMMSGIVIGILWWIKSIISSILLSKKEIEQFRFNVAPIFNLNLLDIRINCIIKIKMVYIITIWIWFFKLKKGGDMIDGTSN